MQWNHDGVFYLCMYKIGHKVNLFGDLVNF